MSGTGAAANVPSAADSGGVALFRQALRSASYEPDRMKVMLRAEGENVTPRPEDVPVVARLLPERDRLADLLRLFLLRLDVPAGRAADALAPLPVERATRLGLVTPVGDAVRGAIRVLPAGEFLFACDRELESAPVLPPDYVMGVSSSSIFLASLTVRTPVNDVLDIGCGGGIQSVLAGGHAKRVIACDINPRALAFTAFNAALNGVTNVECRAGSFFEPVKGELFDLVVSNPPFVVSPDSAMAFRDSGMRADDVSRHVVQQAAAHLRDGGLAFVLVSWGIPNGGRWEDPLQSWVRDTGCDAWFLHQSQATPLGYAATWSEPLQRAAAGAYEVAIDRWVRYYRELGYGALAYGGVILRKRKAATHWTRADDVHGQREPASGEQIARLIAAEDYLASHSDEQVLRGRFGIEPEHRLDQTLRVRDGAFAVEGATLRLETGLRFNIAIDAFTAELLTRLDGKRTLTQAASEAAKRFAGDGLVAADVDAEAVAATRRLMALGFVRLTAR